MITRILARSPRELEEISWRAHDADFDPALVVLDADGRSVTVPFVQEPRDLEEGLPASAHMRSTWRFEEYAVPFLRCTLVIHQATGLRMSADVREEASELLGVDVAEAEGMVSVQANWGTIEVPVTELDAELAISDEIADVRRRRVGRGRRWDSTTRWPAERQGAVAALVRRRAGPPLPLHAVSSIVRPPR